MSERERLATARMPDEDEYAYIYRICSMKDVIGTWADIAGILNEQLGYEYTESRYRKQYQSFNRMFESNQEKLNAGVYADSIVERTREMNRERMKLQTEKLEYNKWLREHARDEMIAERIVDAIRDLPEIEVPDVYDFESIRPSTDRVGILCYGDEHFGAEFLIKGLYGETLNEYSPEIYMDRMEQLFQAVKHKVYTNGLSQLKIYSLGDEIDGILRASQLMKLRYGVVEASMRYAEYVSQWLNRLTSYVEVEFHMTEGNHSELRMIGQPKGTFSEDNMSKVIKQFIKIRLENNPRFRMIENECGLIYDEIHCFNILGIHGEVKNLGTALKDFSTMYDTRIDILICGHKHHSTSETIGICKDVITIPSIVGVDSYSLKIGKTANAGATFLIVEPVFGVTEHHHIKFI